MKKKKFSPVFIFLFLTLCTMIISLILSLIGVQAEYTTVNTYSYTLQNNVVEIQNMLSTTGIKYIVTNTVKNFLNFEPLGSMIIVLIGMGVLEKSGFFKAFFPLLTRKLKKNAITFTVIVIAMLSGVLGDLGFVILLPLSALLFKYGRRNPLGGIIASFAGLVFGSGINILLTTTDTSLLTYTLNAAHVIDSNYVIGNYFELFIMLVAAVVASIIMTHITEKSVMPKLGRYEFEEETVENPKLTNRELRALILSLIAGLIYSLIIIILIIPGLPIGGSLLDKSGTYYMDQLFGPNSLFAQGFVFIVTFLFILVGLVYGFVSKSIRNNKDVSDCLSYSLDTIGSVIVLMLTASIFISVYNKSNLGIVITAGLTNLFGLFNFSSVPTIIIFFIIAILTGLFSSGIVSKWQIVSASVVPKLMNLSVSPELAQIIFTAGSTLSLGLTPIMTYYVVYIAFIEKYDKENQISMMKASRYILSYAKVLFIMWFIIIIGFYVAGLPLGVGSTSMLKF